MTAKHSTFEKYLNFQKNITHQPLHFISGLQDGYGCERMFFVAWQWHQHQHQHHSMKETERQVPEYFVHKIVTYFDGGWNSEHEEEEDKDGGQFRKDSPFTKVYNVLFIEN